MNNGFIVLYRKFMEWEWYHDSDMVHLFLHLLLKANHKKLRWKGVEIDRGQLITGRKALSAELGISERKIRTALHRLEHISKEIAIQSTNRFSIITICKYSDYQNEKQKSDQPNANKRPATDQQPTTNNNDNNDKQEYRAHVLLSESEYNTLIDKYKKVRVERMLDKLENYKLSSGKTYDSDYGAINSWVAGHILKEMPLQAQKYHQ